jgi:uncharacterized protein YggE
MPTIQPPSLRTRWLGTGALAALLVVALATPSLGPRSARAVDPTGTTPEHTISVTGLGRVTIAPDVADLRLGVQLTRQTVKAARADAAAAMTKVVAALRAAGIAEKDIQTAALSLQPMYDYSNGGSQGKLTGFMITNVVAATVRDLERVSEAVDGAMAAGATTVDGVTFRVEDQAAAEAQARTQAIAQAKAKAEQLASAAGVSIVGVASIAEGSGSVPVPMPYAAGAKAAALDVATPIAVGTNEVQVSVSVSYLID